MVTAPQDQNLNANTDNPTYHSFLSQFNIDTLEQQILHRAQKWLHRQ